MIQSSRKSRSVRIRSGLVAVCVGALALVATQVSAVTKYNYYQGTMCEAAGDGYHWNSQKVKYLSNGAILNDDSVRAIALTCPGVEHQFPRRIDGYVRIFKSDANQYTACTLNTKNFSGTGGSFSSKVAPAGTGLKTLYFDAINASTTHNISCLMPRKVSGQKSGVLFYTIYEIT